MLFRSGELFLLRIEKSCKVAMHANDRTYSLHLKMKLFYLLHNLPLYPFFPPLFLIILSLFRHLPLLFLVVLCIDTAYRPVSKFQILCLCYFQSVYQSINQPINQSINQSIFLFNCIYVFVYILMCLV